MLFIGHRLLLVARQVPSLLVYHRSGILPSRGAHRPSPAPYRRLEGLSPPHSDRGLLYYNRGTLPRGLGVQLRTARRQSLGVLRRMQKEMAAGRIPAVPIIDGIIHPDRRRGAANGSAAPRRPRDSGNEAPFTGRPGAPPLQALTRARGPGVWKWRGLRSGGQAARAAAG